MTDRRRIGTTGDAPAPAGPYSQAVRIGDLVHTAGQVGRRPDGTLVSGVAEQTRQALRNVLAALASCGAGQEHIISMRVFLVDTDDFEAMNAAYVDVLQPPYPSRSTLFVGLRPGNLVEIEALALVTD